VTAGDRRVPLDPAELERLAADAVARARRAGADHAEVTASASRSFSVRVHDGRIETLKQSATRALALRVIVGGAAGEVSSTDLGPASLDDLAAHAVALARFSTPDDANRLPLPEETAADAPGDLGTYDPAVLAWDDEAKIALALELERLALAHDPRIRRSDGAGVSSRDGARAVANSDGLVRSNAGTSASVWVVALADEGGGKQQTGVYSSTRRHLADLEDAAEVAAEAGRRAVSRLGARPVPTARVPVVMHPDIAASWLSELYDAFTAEAIMKKSSWLTGRLGEPIAAPIVTLIDDGRLPRGLGTTPWDSEGVPTRRNVLIERGRLAMFEYDAYHARRLGERSTGNSAGGGIGYHNLYLEPGAESPEAILRKVERGFYLDEQGSFGFNSVTGDYSYQAQGFWIEDGEKAFPVEGVTVASTSLDMLQRVVAVGNDLKWDGAVCSPTLLIAEMTVSGT
jgi:PmbA protein